jgi:tRNA(Ile2) C34 agmatinyltransferase TiaS
MSGQLYYYRAKPPREVLCQRCGVTFIHRGQGLAKYCMDCRDIVIENHSHRITERIKAGVK